MACISLQAWLLGGGAAAPVNSGEGVPKAQLEERHRAFLRAYCVECHRAEKRKGELRLDDVSLVLDTVRGADLWQKVLNQINSGEMPPEEAKQPEKGHKADFLDALSGVLVVARKTLSDVQGDITMRRLNRREYANTLRDLLGVELDVSVLPADGGAGSFDTVGSALFMSSSQIEQYLALGRTALDRALVKAPPPQRKRMEAEAVVPGMERSIVRMRETHEKFEKWKAAGSKPEEIAAFGLRGDVTAVQFGEVVWQGAREPMERYLARPEVKTGLLLENTMNETNQVAWDLPPELPSGEYVFRVRAGRVPAMPEKRAFLSFFQASPIDKADTTFLASRHITAPLSDPMTVELPFQIVENGPRKFLFMEKRSLFTNGFSLQGYTRGLKDFQERDPALWIDWIEWEGPLPPKRPRNALEGSLPADMTKANRGQAREALARFATRAFRGRAPEPELLERLLQLFDLRTKAGEPFEVAIRTPLSVVLASPEFLYLYEPVGDRNKRPLNDLELASRLSYFLWSAPPDDTLLALAQSGELQKSAVRQREVDRLIASERASEFISGFLHQWLAMERLDFFRFNTKNVADFETSVKMSARREVYETFGYLLRNGGSLAQLLKSDFVVINGLMASYYGIAGVEGDAFRKVPVPANSPRGGLLGMAAILAMGSNGEVTSPVERGAWVLRKLLHDPPPPAPANVPQLTRLEAQSLTTRERLGAHQEEAQCLQCHRKIDPIGFGLENFDAGGRWRTEDSYWKRGVPGLREKRWTIDPAGAFHKGPAFKDYFELRDLIARQPERFARGFTEALIEYALGRPYGFSDEPLAEWMMGVGRRNGFSIRAMLQAMVASEHFRMK
jgi:hypothetical protein